MGFWRSDPLSAGAGADMLAGILPRTATWAALQVSWLCAALVERRQVDVPRAMTLFQLTPQLDFSLSTWVKEQKRALANADGLVPTGEAHASVGDALEKWKLVSPQLLTASRRASPVPGARALSVGTVDPSKLTDEDGILDAVSRLAAGYVHSHKAGLVVPFMELR